MCTHLPGHLTRPLPIYDQVWGFSIRDWSLQLIKGGGGGLQNGRGGGKFYYYEKGCGKSFSHDVNRP